MPPQIQYQRLAEPLEPSLFRPPPPLSWVGFDDNPPSGHRPRQPGFHVRPAEPSLVRPPPPLAWVGFDDSPPTGHRPRQQPSYFRSPLPADFQVEVITLDKWYRGTDQPYFPAKPRDPGLFVT